MMAAKNIEDIMQHHAQMIKNQAAAYKAVPWAYDEPLDNPFPPDPPQPAPGGAAAAMAMQAIHGANGPMAVPPPKFYQYAVAADPFAEQKAAGYDLNDYAYKSLTMKTAAPEQPKPAAPAKKQRKKERLCNADEGKRPPGRRVSYQGYRYEDATEEQWMLCEPIGWVHNSENYSFNNVFRKDDDSGAWIHRSESERFYSEGNTAGWCHQSTHSGKIARCQYSQRLYLSKELIAVYRGDGSKIVAAAHYVDTEFRTCEISKKMFPRNSMVNLQQNKKQIKWVHGQSNEDAGVIGRCGCCEKWFMREDLEAYNDIPDYVGSYMCKSCHNKKLNHGLIMKHDYKCELNPIYTKRYNAMCGGKVEANSYRWFGVEVETEFNKPALVKAGLNRFSMSKFVSNAIGRDFSVVKEDGSLTMNGKYCGNPEYDKDGTKNGKEYAGFEIVSCPADIDEHRKRWALFDKMENHDMLRAWDTETCGLHVHVSRNSLTLLQIGRIIAFVNHPVNRHFIQKIAGRSESKYCKNHHKKLADSLHPEQGNYDEKRRVAVNVQNEHTIEFRIFRGTVRSCHIIRNIEFVDSLCDYCYPAARGFNDLFAPHPYIQYVMDNKARWPILAFWLIQSGLSKNPLKPSKLAPKEKFDIETDLDRSPLKSIKSDYDAIGFKSSKKVDTAQF